MVRMGNMTKLTALLALAAPLAAAGGFSFGSVDEFGREGDRAFKDTIEGKAPPALAVDGWINTDGKPLSWEALRGKVVVLDFWGTW